MKAKSFLLAMLALLLLGAMAGAAELAQAAAPAAPPAVAEFEALVELFNATSTSENCGKSLLPELDAAPIVEMAYTNTCGQCSNNPCKGRTRGTPCGFNVWCIPTLTNFCPGTQDWDCQCASHYY